MNYFVSASLILFLLTPACITPTGSTIRLNRSMTTLCEEQCQKLGLELSAMAIMANNAGCICTPNASQVEANDQTKASSVSAGMVTIMLQREANRRENAARNEAVERL